eukprot:COSAG01_NODE_1675_length_9535_cov_6.782959_8_plen_74_part_00
MGAVCNFLLLPKYPKGHIYRNNAIDPARSRWNVPGEVAPASKYEQAVYSKSDPQHPHKPGEQTRVAFCSMRNG